MIGIAPTSPGRFQPTKEFDGIDGELLNWLVDNVRQALSLRVAGQGLTMIRGTHGTTIRLTPNLAAAQGLVIIPVALTQNGGSNGSGTSTYSTYGYTCKSLDGSLTYDNGTGLSVFYNRYLPGPVTVAGEGWGIGLNIPSTQGPTGFNGGVNGPQGPFTLMWTDERPGTVLCGM